MAYWRELYTAGMRFDLLGQLTVVHRTCTHAAHDTTEEWNVGL